MRLVLSCLILFGVGVLAPFARADGLVPCGGPGEPRCDFSQVMALINNLMDFLVMVGGFLLVFIIMIGGVYLASSRGNASVQTKVRSLIVNAIIGYILLLGAWFLVETFFKFFATDPVNLKILNE